MLNSDVNIRAALPKDIPELLRHMRSLAEFERYISEFTVDEESLLSRAFSKHPECYIFVSEDSNGIVGYAVMVAIPFTYDLKITMIIKEFFVADKYRGCGVGSRLFRHIAAWALAKGAGRLKWDVMAGNSNAEKFYRKHGAGPDNKWIPYVINEDALKSLLIPSE